MRGDLGGKVKSVKSLSAYPSECLLLRQLSVLVEVLADYRVKAWDNHHFSSEPDVLSLSWEDVADIEILSSGWVQVYLSGGEMSGRHLPKEMKREEVQAKLSLMVQDLALRRPEVLLLRKLTCRLKVVNAVNQPMWHFYGSEWSKDMAYRAATVFDKKGVRPWDRTDVLGGTFKFIWEFEGEEETSIIFSKACNTISIDNNLSSASMLTVDDWHEMESVLEQILCGLI